MPQKDHINRLRQMRYIIDVYNKLEKGDKSDAEIVECIFPDYGIFISYRTWMNLKSMPPPKIELPQAKKHNRKF